jgi:hypothetical protein
MAKGRKTGGRVKGSVNKLAADIKGLAQSYGPSAIRRLAELSGLLVGEDGQLLPPAESQSTQTMAIKELLDRGFGKATQLIAGDDDEAPVAISMRVKFVRPSGTGSRPS